MVDYATEKELSDHARNCPGPCWMKKGFWKGSTLVVVFLAVATAIAAVGATVGSMAVANGATIEAQGKAQVARDKAVEVAQVARDKAEADAQVQRTDAQRREFDQVNDRLERIESLVRTLKEPG